MPKREARLYLEVIVSSISKIQDYIKDLSFQDFINDQMLLDAVVRNLEIIGEAARNIPPDISSKHIDVEWGKMVSMRNKVMHEYFGVDEEILWKTISDDLPSLKSKIEKLLESSG